MYIGICKANNCIALHPSVHDVLLVTHTGLMLKINLTTANNTTANNTARTIKINMKRSPTYHDSYYKMVPANLGHQRNTTLLPHALSMPHGTVIGSTHGCYGNKKS